MNGDSEDNVGEVSALWTRVDQADGGQAEALPGLHDALLGHGAGRAADGQAEEEESAGWRGMSLLYDSLEAATADMAFVCERCGWNGLEKELIPLGSVGRISCPKCHIDTGPGGAVPVDRLEWQRRVDACFDAEKARRENAAKRKRGGGE